MIVLIHVHFMFTDQPHLKFLTLLIFNDSPVTCTQFCSDCPKDFIKALSAAPGSRTKRKQFHRENSSSQVCS